VGGWGGGGGGAWMLGYRRGLWCTGGGGGSPGAGPNTVPILIMDLDVDFVNL
jgi:hypothetical protein